MFGVFPLDTLMTFLRNIAASKLNMQYRTRASGAELMKLQGIEQDQAETFSKEGVGTMLQLAYADPIDLTIRTGFSFSYVTDCCSQALAWLRFEDNMQKLKKFGLRGAQEITTFVYELSYRTDQSQEIMNQEKEWSEKTLAALAIELKMDKDNLRNILDDIAYDPYSQCLYDIWQPDWN
jgi:hypothetical protein